MAWCCRLNDAEQIEPNDLINRIESVEEETEGIVVLEISKFRKYFKKYQNSTYNLLANTTSNVSRQRICCGQFFCLFAF